jgi:hypothetical protein
VNPGATKDDSQFIGMSQPTVGIHESVEEPMQGSLLGKNQVVTILDLGHKELMAIATLAFLVAEKRQQLAQPVFDRGDDVGW